MEERIKLIMKNLECSREEAIQVIKDDEAIDKGEKMFELSNAKTLEICQNGLREGYLRRLISAR